MTSGETVTLSGIDGTNPLGFLATMGAVSLLVGAGEERLRVHWGFDRTWQPIVSDLTSGNEKQIAQTIAKTMSAESRAEMDLASAADHNDRVIDPSRETYRTVAERQLSSAVVESRTEADMIASFASDAVVDTDRQGRVYTNKEGLPKLAATSFQFARGSGHQYFLGTVYQLMERLDAERIQKMLFQRWDYSDEKLALRWDPIEDRRYALMDKDPTASDRKVKSMWMANLLAYRGLQLFPSVPTTHGLETTGWSEQSRRHFFRWPLWSVPVGFDALRTLLVLDELHQTYLDKKRLKETGITAVYVSERIRVGSGANFKFNFAPAQLA